MLLFFLTSCLSRYATSYHVSRSRVNEAIASFNVGSLKCASSLVSQTANDGQNDAAEFLCSELPNEDASQEHSDICCVVKMLLLLSFMALDLLFGGT